jgi:hypothetical protein
MQIYFMPRNRKQYTKESIIHTTHIVRLHISNNLVHKALYILYFYTSHKISYTFPHPTKFSKHTHIYNIYIFIYLFVGVQISKNLFHKELYILGYVCTHLKKFSVQLIMLIIYVHISKKQYEKTMK